METEVEIPLVENDIFEEDIGCPTTITEFLFEGTMYNYASLEYFGRQLTSIDIYDSSNVLVHEIDYTYNDQGYRTSKTIDETTIIYTLSGDKVLFETDGTYGIIYTYDIDGTIISFSYDNDITNGESYTDYYYVRNLQGDITKIFRMSGTSEIVLVEYEYDAWGNIIQIKYNQSYLSEAQNIHEVNQYFYRGYRLDKETNLYYLNSRYYDANVGRFINSDGLLGAQGNILGHNMYAYTQNNPVMLTDSTGYWAGVDDLIAFGTGFVVGAAGQLVSDLITSAMIGEWSFSSVEVYAGAALGGAAGAMVLLYTGNPIAAGATTGFVTTFVGMGLESLTGKSDATFLEILGHSAVDAGIGAALGGIVKALGGMQGINPGSKLPKISGGRGNWNAVWRSSLKGGAYRSNKVLMRGAASLALDGLTMDMYYGIKQRTLLAFD